MSLKATLILAASLTVSPASAAAHGWKELARAGPVDSHVPDLHEQQVFAKTYCAAFPGPDCTPRTADSLVFYGGLVSTSVVYGSFSRPGVREALVTQCAAESDRCEGVTLLRYAEPGWRVVHRTAGITPRECLKFRSAQRRDVLACRANTIFLPNFGLSLDFVAADTKQTYSKPLLPTRNLNCLGTPGPVRLDRLGTWDRRDANGDGHPDLQVQLHRYTLNFADQQACGRGSPRSVSGTTVSLTWLMQDGRLVPEVTTGQRPRSLYPQISVP